MDSVEIVRTKDGKPRINLHGNYIFTNTRAFFTLSKGQISELKALFKELENG